MKRNTIAYFHKPALYGCASLLAILAAQHQAGAQQATPVPDVNVTAPTAPAAQPLDGSAAAGYRVKDSTAAGPIFADLPLQDAPYSISVVPAPLIENLQAWQPEDIAKVIPQITSVLANQNKGGNTFFYIRGFAISQFSNGAGVTYDGMLGGAGGMFEPVLEDKERVEVLSGVDGFLYGTGSVGGNINYVLKRPTLTPLYDITIGDNAGANGYIHADLGGPLHIPGLADGLLGYRLNIVGQDGHTSLDGQNIARDLVSAAFDIHLPYGALLQLNAAHSNYKITGLTPVFTSSLIPFPAPANPASVVANSWQQFANQTDTGGLKLTWKLNDIFTLRTAYDYTYEDRPYFNSYRDIIANYQGLMSNNAVYDGFVSASSQWYTHSGYSFLDAQFSTFGIRHKLTAGFTGFSQYTNNGSQTEVATNFAAPGNFYAQTPQPAPTFVYGSTPGYIGKHLFATNYVLGDEIKFNDQFSILAGGNYTALGTETFNSNGTGALTGHYDAAALTPNVSLIYKVLPWFTTYATYQQSLQSGEVVTNSAAAIYTNNGAILPPYIGHQYEVGAKANVGTNLLLTAALFDIDKANLYTQTNPNGTSTAFEGGTETHKGVELTATGKVWADLTIVGGVTLMDARISNNPTAPAQDGSIPQYVSPMSEKIYAEYDIPFIPSMPFLRGLTLIGGFHWSSYYYMDVPNMTKMPGYAVEDAGFRYTTKVADKIFVLRFNVNNILNTAYWQPGGAGSNVEGLPRTFLATAEMKF